MKNTKAQNKLREVKKYAEEVYNMEIGEVKAKSYEGKTFEKSHWDDNLNLMQTVKKLLNNEIKNAELSIELNINKEKQEENLIILGFVGEIVESRITHFKQMKKEGKQIDDATNKRILEKVEQQKQEEKQEVEKNINVTITIEENEIIGFLRLEDTDGNFLEYLVEKQYNLFDIKAFGFGKINNTRLQKDYKGWEAGIIKAGNGAISKKDLLVIEQIKQKGLKQFYEYDYKVIIKEKVKTNSRDLFRKKMREKTKNF